jgi:hypothetical protein
MPSRNSWEMSDSHGVSFGTFLGTVTITMANPIDELHSVFKMCGITNPATHTTIIDQDGFTQLEDLGVLEMDADISEMVK